MRRTEFYTTPDEWQASRPRRAAYGHMDIASDGTVDGARGWLASVARTDGGRACRGATPVVWDAEGRCRAAAGGERLPRGDVRWGVFRGGHVSRHFKIWKCLVRRANKHCQQDWQGVSPTLATGHAGKGQGQHIGTS